MAGKTSKKATKVAKKVPAKSSALSNTSKRVIAADKVKPDWRDVVLTRIRLLISQAVPNVVEERKWKKPSNAMAGIPVWSYHGILCTGETYKNYVKLTFAKGAGLPDPARLFNASLEGGTRRAIDICEGDKIDGSAFKSLIRAAASVNESTARK